MIRTIYLTFVALLLSVATYAQSGLGEIRGVAKDAVTGAVMEFMSIRVEKNGVFVTGTITDLDGNYFIKAISPGTYTIKATSIGYKDQVIEGVVVNPDQITFLNLNMNEKVEEIEQVEIIFYKVPLVEKDKNAKTIGGGAIKRLPTRNVNTIATTVAGVYSVNGGTPSFRGSRADGTAYYIDGVRVTGSFVLPQASQDQIQILQGGVPAQYGDFTGGAISVTTRGPSRRVTGSLELITSSVFDKYNYNQLEGSISGPLLIRNRDSGRKERVVLGYSISAHLRYQDDPDPAAGGVYVVKDDVLEQIKANPLINSEQGLIPRSSFLTLEDLEKVDAKPNTQFQRGIITAKVEYQPSANTNITIFGSFNSDDRNLYSYNHTLMNYDANPNRVDNTYRSYIKFTQRIKSDAADKGKTPLISNAFYSIRFDYQSRNVKTWDDEHREDVFKYGYLGKFTTYQEEAYTYFGDLSNPNGESKTFVDQHGNTVSLRNFWEQTGFRDTLFTFERASFNPTRANYTSDYYGTLQQNPVTSTQVISGGGLLNGQSSSQLNVYSLFYNPGAVTTGFNKAQFERYTLFAVGEASVNSRRNTSKKHDLQFGLTYEQQINRSYFVDANRLWLLMPQLANRHIQTLDQSNPYLVYDDNGVFLDTVKYNRLIDSEQQSTFDRNFRTKLIQQGATDIYGNPITETSFIDINSYSPEDFDISMFGADELIGNGGNNPYASYYGYSHTGEIVRGRPSVNDFVNNPNERIIGAYAPIYNAVWLQDKFAFKDLIFRLGVRIERFDANQRVLRDPYSLYPVKTAGEVSELDNGLPVVHPDNIGDDYVVYVNNVNSASEIVGYRNGNQWYDANGTEVANPDIVAQNSNGGQIQPYLVDPQNQELSEESFEDYNPQVNVLPRIWFSFPISTTAQFFANYDVLAQRPGSGLLNATIDDYFYMEQRSNRTFANPALKPRLKTDYEVGFKQQIGFNSALSLIASYSEIRNDFNQFRFNEAYPISYTSYSNIDFSTIKGFRIEYELRDAGAQRNLNLTANYTLQYADGTGSNANSAGALIQSGQPNLRSLFPLDIDIRHQFVTTIDYRYGEGKRYNGPTWARKDSTGKRTREVQLLKNTGANFIITGRSGAPYTSTTFATARAQAALGTVQRSQIKGTPFGSRLPWQFNVDVTFDKTLMMKVGTTTNKEGKEIAKRLPVNVFLWISNILDTRNVIGVYQYTGLADDDGYLNSPQGQDAIQQQINTQSFVDLYRIKSANPDNYVTPRLIRIGARVYF